MRVLMFGWELPPHNSGGLGVACYGLARGLSHTGTQIAFALPRRLPGKIPFMHLLDHRLQGVEFTAINARLRAYLTNKEYCSLYGHNWEQGDEIYGYSLYEEAHRFADMATNWARTQQHDVIHAHDWMTYLAGMRASAVSGRPLVTHIHATEFDRTGGNVDPRIAEIEYQGLNAANKVIAVSHYTKNVIHDKYCVPLEKITVVHNGVDPVEFSPADIRQVFPYDNIVLFVGRLTFQKGVEYFLRAAKRVLERRPNTVFLVAGSGDMEQRLIMEAAYLGIGNRVVFTGHMTGSRLNALYRMADVFVMPSVSEPYGIVALEAVVSGTPVIISKQSGVAETLSNVYKVDFWDVHKMARQIMTLLDYPQMASEIAKQAKNEAEQMSWERAAASVLDVYRSVIQ